MIKTYSQTRDAYDERYRWMRIAKSQGASPYIFPILTQAQNAAARSYDNHDARLLGWINLDRRERFMLLLQAKVFREDYFRR